MKMKIKLCLSVDVDNIVGSFQSDVNSMRNLINFARFYCSLLFIEIGKTCMLINRRAASLLKVTVRLKRVTKVRLS